MKALRASSVPLVLLPDNTGPESLAEKVRLVGRAVGAEAKADELATSLENQFRELADVRSKISKPARAIVVLSVSSGRALVGGRGTTAT